MNRRFRIVSAAATFWLSAASILGVTTPAVAAAAPAHHIFLAGFGDPNVWPTHFAMGGAIISGSSCVVRDGEGSVAAVVVDAWTGATRCRASTTSKSASSEPARSSSHGCAGRASTSQAPLSLWSPSWLIDQYGGGGRGLVSRSVGHSGCPVVWASGCASVERHHAELADGRFADGLPRDPADGATTSVVGGTLAANATSYVDPTPPAQLSATSWPPWAAAWSSRPPACSARWRAVLPRLGTRRRPGSASSPAVA